MWLKTTSRSTHKLKLYFLAALVATLVLASGVACSKKGRTHPRPTETSPATNAAIAGTWVGQTEEDGTLTLVIEAGGDLSYAFSGGCRENGAGEYTIEGGIIHYWANPPEDNDDVVWHYSLDGANLRITMEDSPEEYVLMQR